MLHREIKNQYFHKKLLTFPFPCCTIQKLSANYAAIAQSVERILGKDEVASSNLASSSKRTPIPTGIGVLFVCFEREPATSSHARSADSIMRSLRAPTKL